MIYYPEITELFKNENANILSYNKLILILVKE